MLFLGAVVIASVLPLGHVYASFSDCVDAGGDYCSSNSTCTTPDTKVINGQSGECFAYVGSTTYACCKSAIPVTSSGICAGKQQGNSCTSGPNAGTCKKKVNVGLVCVAGTTTPTSVAPTTPTPTTTTPAPTNTPTPISTTGTACEPGFKPSGNLCFPTGTGLSEKPMKDILVAVLGWILGLFGVLGILVFIVSGITYFTAAGDAEQEKKAKNAMTMGIIGVIVGLAGFVIIQAISSALNASNSF